MAKSVHREGNIARWVGVRPAHNGVPIVVQASANNALVTVYTVPSGYVLLVNVLSAQIFCTAAAAAAGIAAVYNTVPAVVFYVSYQYSVAVGNINQSLSFPIPLEMVAGWTYKLNATAGTVQVYGSLHGFLVPTNEFD